MAKRKAGRTPNRRTTKPSVSKAVSKKKRPSPPRKPVYKKKPVARKKVQKKPISYKQQYEKLVRTQAKDIKAIKDLLKQQGKVGDPTSAPQGRAGRDEYPPGKDLPQEPVVKIPKSQADVLEELRQLKNEIQQRAMMLDELMSGPGKFGVDDEYFKD